MRKSATTIAIVALGAMLVAGSATESMAHGGGGGHSSGGGHGDFGGGHRGGGGIFGRGGISGDAHGLATSHSHFAGRRDHFRDFRRDDNYWGPYYSCEYPFRWNSPAYYDYCQ